MSMSTNSGANNLVNRSFDRTSEQAHSNINDPSKNHNRLYVSRKHKRDISRERSPTSQCKVPRRDVENQLKQSIRSQNMSQSNETSSMEQASDVDRDNTNPETRPASSHAQPHETSDDVSTHTKQVNKEHKKHHDNDNANMNNTRSQDTSMEIIPYAAGRGDNQLIRHHAFLPHEGENSTSGEPAMSERRPKTEIWTFGSGMYGQTMQKRAGSWKVPTLVQKDFLQHVNVISVALSASHSIIVTEQGEIYAAGNNEEGEICPESEESQLMTPRLLDMLSAQRVVQVSAGPTHTAALTVNQNVVAWGSNEMRQLGHSVDKAFHVAPRVMRGLGSKLAVQVSCGDAHTVVLTACGKVYACGSNAVGATGHGELRDNKAELTPVEGLYGVPIAQISAGGHHTLACAISGLVYAWGRNRYGQLGLSTKKVPHAAFTPKRVDIAVPIQQAIAGVAHSAFVSRSGELFVCGRGTCGQLGLGFGLSASIEIARKEYMKKTQRSDTGQRERSAGLDGLRGKLAPSSQKDDSVSGNAPEFTAPQPCTETNWSRMRQTLISDGAFTNVEHPFSAVDQPTRVKALANHVIREVACGDRHTLVLTVDGEIWGFGANNEGQLGVQRDIASVWDSLQNCYNRDYLKWLKFGGGGMTGNSIETSTFDVLAEPKFVPAPVCLEHIRQSGIFSIAAGGDTSATIRVTRGSVLSQPPGTLPRGVMHFIDTETLRMMARRAASTQNFAPLKRVIHDIFGQASSLCASFLLPWVFMNAQYTDASSDVNEELSNLRAARVKQNALSALVPYKHSQVFPGLLQVRAPFEQTQAKTQPPAEQKTSMGLRIRANSASELGQLTPNTRNRDQSHTSVYDGSLSARVTSRPSEFRSLLEASTPRPRAQIREAALLGLPPSSLSTPTQGVSVRRQEAETETQEISNDKPKKQCEPLKSPTSTDDVSAHQVGSNHATSTGTDNQAASRPSMIQESKQVMRGSTEIVGVDANRLGSLSSPTFGMQNSSCVSSLKSVYSCLRMSSGIDIEGLEAAYVALLQTYEPSVISTLVTAVRSVLDELEPHAKTLEEPDQIRALLVLMLCPVAQSPSAATAELSSRICAIILAMPKQSRDILCNWIRRDVPSYLFATRLVRPLQAHISYYLSHAMRGLGSRSIAACPKFMKHVLEQARSSPPPPKSALAAQMASELSMKDGIHDVKALELAIRTMRLLYMVNCDVADAQRKYASLGHLEELEWDVLPGRINSVSTIALGKSISSVSRSDFESANSMSEYSNPSELEGSNLGTIVAAQSTGVASDTAGVRVWGKVSYEEFHNSDISSIPEALMQRDYERWRQSGFNRTVEDISLCAYSFLMNADAKRRVLQFEAALTMNTEMRNAFARSMFFSSESPYLVLTVRRTHLVQDSLNQIAMCSPVMLKKPLKIIFHGEEGIDAGGVLKEWFQLLIRDVFDVSFGMFTYNESTREFWFNPAATDTPAEYRLVGLILGLAIYNRVLLDAHLPQVAYRKLLGYDVTFTDLSEVNPSLYQGFEQLLNYEQDDVEDVFCVTFEATYDYYGSTRTVALVPGGAEKPVTAQNRTEYVRLYANWVLNNGIESQFQEFRKGFMMAMDGHALRLFRPEELELVVCGTPHLDFKELEKVTEYEGDISKTHPTIKLFWEVIHEMSSKLQRKFLTFVTGCDRAPVGGLGNLKFKIQRHGGGEGDETRLPSASTCFNTLLLPIYTSKEHLRNALLTAITETEGFGLQ